MNEDSLSCGVGMTGCGVGSSIVKSHYGIGGDCNSRVVSVEHVGSTPLLEAILRDSITMQEQLGSVICDIKDVHFALFGASEVLPPIAKPADKSQGIVRQIYDQKDINQELLRRAESALKQLRDLI